MLSLVLTAVLVIQAPTLPAPDDEVLRVARAARNADLQADWMALAASHDTFETLRTAGAPRAWVDYYLGYVDWRRSALALIGEGQPALVSLMEAAGGHFRRALASAPDFADARILLALTQVFSQGTPPDSAEANRRRAIAAEPHNPRVRLVSVMMTYFSPRTPAAARDSALGAWRTLAAAFPAAAAGEPEWGPAETWGWLGGALLVRGDTTGAGAALERALEDRPDFWWVRSMALPQTRVSRRRHGESF